MPFTRYEVLFREDVCRDCGEGCTVDRTDPCAACYRHLWHAWPKEVETVSMPPVAPAQPRRLKALHILRGWKRAGLGWVSRPVRRQILPICRGCDLHRIDARTGLVACAAGCNCGVAAVAVIREGARCELGQWPSSPA